jgi:hypothetical protein
MSDALFRMHDIIEIAPQQALVDLEKAEKHRLMDAALNPRGESSRGLKVTFNLSSSGRRINNRIYTPKGQQAGIPSWTTPYAKPIIRNHDRNEDPMGRFMSVDYRYIDEKALGFFKTGRDFMMVKDALDSDDPKKIYKTLSNSKLLTNSKWPGVGELIATARVTDEKAVEKFLDGRYMTFSAGSNTDRYVCGLCQTDWATGEQCDHTAGEIVDGQLVVFVTGTFFGDEASVLTTPANDYSAVLALEHMDSLKLNIPKSACLTDTTTIYITDGLVDMMAPLSDETEEQTMDIDALVDSLLPKLLEKLAAVETEKATLAKAQADAAAAEAETKRLQDEETARVAAEEAQALRDAEDQRSLQQKLEDALAAKAELVRTAAEELATLRTELDDLKKDHVAALQMIDSLKAEKDSNELDTETASVQNNDSKQTNVLDKARGSIENPSESGTPALQDKQTNLQKDLDNYEKGVVNKYLKIRDERGEKVAQHYVTGLKRNGYLSRKFDIDMYTKEND